MDVTRTVTARVGGIGRRAFGALARARGEKALHPHGTVVHCTVHHHGTGDGGGGGGAHRATGVPWIDGTGRDRGLVRFSGGAGLPAPWPDVQGLALRVPGPDGGSQDLLLASTGDSGWGRRVPLPRRSVRRGTLSSIAAFRTPAGPLLIGARWRGDRFRLAWARPHGAWQPFADLLLDAEPSTAPDDAITFDPVLNAFEGLEFPARWRRLREPGYAGSRAGRRAGRVTPDPVSRRRGA